MSIESANAAIDRMEADEAFAARVRDAGGPGPAGDILRAEGFDATPDDMRDALIDRYGGQLNDEQLEQLTAGISDFEVATFAVLGTVAAVGAAGAAV